MKNNHKKTILTLLACVGVMSFSLIDKLGGDFYRELPSKTESKLSDGAKKLIEKSFEGFEKGETHDHHTHIVGLDEHQGTYINGRMLEWWRFAARTKTNVYMSGSGVEDETKANEQYLERLVDLIRSIKGHGKYHILGFDKHYRKDGTVDNEKTEFYVSNKYIYGLYEKYPDIFVPVISVHPYRKDAVAELEKWAKKGVRWIKWLPNAQGMNASDEQIDEYYKTMKKYDMILLTHVGEEHAVKADDYQALGNPLLFRRPLDMGVKVVMAHCASRGEDEDFDNSGTKKPSFDLFMRMMDEKQYEGLLYGEISVTTQFNRLPKPLMTLLERKDLHARLLDGSDYPLPAINVIIHTKKLLKLGLINAEEREYLNEIYKYNPLLFDYVVKRTIKHPLTKEKLSDVIFTDIDNKLRGDK